MPVSDLPGVQFVTPQHRAFDAVLDWMLAVCAWGSFIDVYKGRQVTDFAPTRQGDRNIYPLVQIAGLATRQHLSLVPHETFVDVVGRNTRQTRVAYIQEPTFQALPGPATNSATLIESLTSALLVRFYEEHVGAIASTAGAPDLWPEVWRFARVVRNAMSHNGKVEIRNPNERSTSYFGLTYSAADNGRPLMHRDLTSADIFQLVLDLAAAL